MTSNESGGGRRAFSRQSSCWLPAGPRAEAELALSTTIDLAESTDSGLHVLHVLTVGPGDPDPFYRVHEAGLRHETYEQALEAVEQEGRRVLDGQVHKVEEIGGAVAEVHPSRGSDWTRP